VGSLEDCKDLRSYRSPGLVGSLAGNNCGNGLAVADIDGDLAVRAIIGAVNHYSIDFVARRDARHRATLREQDRRGVNHSDAASSRRKAEFIHARIGNYGSNHVVRRDLKLYFDIDWSRRNLGNFTEKRVPDTEFNADSPKEKISVMLQAFFGDCRRNAAELFFEAAED
jgi:hypothetical protein